MRTAERSGLKRTATSRFDTEPGPEELAWTQDLVNSKRPGDAPVVDLLGALPVAQQWFDGAVSASDGPGFTLTARDLEELRELRATVEAQLARDPGARPMRGVVRLSAREGSSAVTAEPLTSSVAEWLEATVLAERHRAELTGQWDRLKLCGDPACRVAFFDRSRNRSGVWHDVERCGNRANLRRFRERRTAGAGAGADHD